MFIWDSQKGKIHHHHNVAAGRYSTLEQQVETSQLKLQALSRESGLKNVWGFETWKIPVKHTSQQGHTS